MPLYPPLPHLLTIQVSLHLSQYTLPFRVARHLVIFSCHINPSRIRVFRVLTVQGGSSAPQASPSSQKNRRILPNSTSTSNMVDSNKNQLYDLPLPKESSTRVRSLAKYPISELESLLAGPRLALILHRYLRPRLVRQESSVQTQVFMCRKSSAKHQNRWVRWVPFLRISLSPP